MSLEGHTFTGTYGFSLMVRWLCLQNTKLLFLCFSFEFSLCLPALYFFLALKNDNGAGPYLFRSHLKAFFPLCELKHTLFLKKIRRPKACLIACHKKKILLCRRWNSEFVSFVKDIKLKICKRRF